MDLSWYEAAVSIAVGTALAAAVGLRVFVPLLLVGLSARAGWLSLGPDFLWLASTAGLATLTVATLVEVAGYYVPAVDNALDVVAGPMAFAAGVVTLAAVTSDLPSPLRWGLAVVAGGGTAGLVQGLTTITRLKSTGLTGGLANPVLATAELVGSTLLSVLAIAVPFLALVVLVGVAVFARRIVKPRRVQPSTGSLSGGAPRP